MFFLLTYIRNIRRRMKKFYHTTKAVRGVLEYKELPNVNNKSSFNNNTYLGRNCHFNGMEISGSGKVTIGDNFHSGIDCLMITDIHNYEGLKIPYDETYIIKDIVIEDNVWIGTRVIILGGVTIGEGAIIQAGSVVVKDVPKCSIAGGHPATVFSYRDENSYYKRKANKLFL